MMLMIASTSLNLGNSWDIKLTTRYFFITSRLQQYCRGCSAETAPGEACLVSWGCMELWEDLKFTHRWVILALLVDLILQAWLFKAEEVA